MLGPKDASMLTGCKGAGLRLSGALWLPRADLCVLTHVALGLHLKTPRAYVSSAFASDVL